MTDRHDDLLWELPRAEASDDRPVPPDEKLLAYRDGRLNAAEEAKLEWELAGSRKGRERLAVLAGVRLDASPRRGRGGWRLASIALAAASILLAVWLGLRPGTAPIPAFDVHVEGLALERGGPGGATAFPDTRVRVHVDPAGDAVAGLSYDAYRLEGNALARVVDLAVEAPRGHAVLSAPAIRLVGDAPGPREFFVVVSRRASLPDRIDFGSAGPAAALAGASGGNVYPVTLTIVRTTDGAP